jgi:hypothetical protein
MKNILLTMIMASGLVFSGCLRAQTVDANAPVISFAKDTIDYGTIAHNSNGDRTVTFSNTGREPLIIKDAHGSCQCTVPTCPKEPLQPGSSAEMKVHYNTNNVGRFVKTVTVISNATQATKIVWIMGNVLPDAPAPLPLGIQSNPNVSK